MIRRRSAIAALAGILVAGIAAAPTSAGTRGCAGGPSAETFEVRTKWNKEVYRPNESVKVEVTVLRPAREDPFDLGIELDPPHQTPVEDAKVIVAFTVGVPPVFGIATTGADGIVRLSIPLKTKARGPIQATTRASITYNESGPDCTNVEEWGRLVESPAFEIRED